MIHYVLTLWFLSILSAVLLSVLSIYYFRKSRNTAPLFLRENELQSRIKSLSEQIAVAQSANNTLSAQNQELSKEAKNLEQTIHDGQAAKEFLEKYDEELASKRNTIDSRYEKNTEDGSEWADLDNVQGGRRNRDVPPLYLEYRTRGLRCPRRKRIRSARGIRRGGFRG